MTDLFHEWDEDLRRRGHHDMLPSLYAAVRVPVYGPEYECEEPEEINAVEAWELGLIPPTPRLRGEQLFGMTERGWDETLDLASYVPLITVALLVLALVWHGAFGGGR